MRRVNNHFNKKILIAVLIIMSVGFAFLNTAVNINGTGYLLPNTWNIYFNNVRVTTGSVSLREGDLYPTISQDKLTVNFHTTLAKPGDFYEFTVDVKNAGTLDAQIDTIINNNLTIQQKKYLDFIIEYANGDPLKQGYILLANQTKTYRVRVEYKRNITTDDLPTEIQNIDISFSCTYTQADEDTYRTATFKNGLDVRTKMLNLMQENNVKAFKQSSEKKDGLTSDNIISTTDSETKIYIWFEEDETDENNSGTIYWYSDADIVFLNTYSEEFFLDSTHNHKFQYLTDISGLSNISTSKVNMFDNFFQDCETLTDISVVSNWTIDQVTTMNHMFDGCKSLTNLDALSNWKTDSLKKVEDMFYNCINLTDIDGLKNWNTTKMKSLKRLFYNCKNIDNLESIANWNIKNVTNLEGTFNGCESITDVDALSNWNTSNVNILNYTFSSCKNLSDISGLSNWDTSKVKEMKNTFGICNSITDVDALAEWNVENVELMNSLFYNCLTLEDISGLSNWNTKSLKNMKT